MIEIVQDVRPYWKQQRSSGQLKRAAAGLVMLDSREKAQAHRQPQHTTMQTGAVD